MPGGNVDAAVVGRSATWLFYIVVAALAVIIGLSVFVVFAWRQVDGSQGCLLTRFLSGVAERYFRRKPKASRRHAQPTPAAEERSRLRRPQCRDVEPAAMGSFHLTVPTMPDITPSSATTSDGGSSGRLHAESSKTTHIN